MKEKLAQAPVLAIYSPNRETELHCDACSHGFGAILVQKRDDGLFHPVSFFSKRASECKSKYHSYELECLAIVYAIKKYEIYLKGIKFKIATDCKSIKLTFSKKEVVPRIMRWVLLLQDFDYSLEHRVGTRMKHVDALSRVYSVMIVEDNSFEQNLAYKQDADEEIKYIREALERQECQFFELKNGLV